MKQLLNILNTVPEFARLAADLESGRSPVEVAGLSPVHRAHFAAGREATAPSWNKNSRAPTMTADTPVSAVTSAHSRAHSPSSAHTSATGQSSRGGGGRRRQL